MRTGFTLTPTAEPKKAPPRKLAEKALFHCAKKRHKSKHKLANLNVKENK
jgi:hypothetical protein